MDKKTIFEIKKYSIRVYSATKDLQHGMQHIKNVIHNAKSIVEKLNKNKIDINIVEAMCYLHDVVISSRNSNNHIMEKPLNKKYFPVIISRFKLPSNEEEIIKTAVINHSYSSYGILNKNKDIYSKILQDADTLDLVSAERKASFNSKRGKTSSYFTYLYFTFIKRNMKNYLNLPESYEIIERNKL